eukprot:TRINITY_DN1055_c0_g1_i1.p1 TRINITY_DN1055_c0_g1~~TRINITY_DN1055_c0_g1_i1.p1  ORF type:complete len:194 (+),score=23.34 TRINITY_DN1055_c0_g1_i1:3128-3709(+)
MKFLQDISMRFGQMAPRLWANTYPECDLAVVFGAINVESLSRECAAQSRVLWARAYPNCEQVCAPNHQNVFPPAIPFCGRAELRDPELTPDQHAQAKQNEFALKQQMIHLERISSGCAAQSRAIWAQAYPDAAQRQPTQQKKMSSMEFLFQCRYHSGGGRLWTVNVDDELMPDVNLESNQYDSLVDKFACLSM